MPIQALKEAIFDRDVRTVNFFNGRLLTAEDLSREQNASREERRRLGRAIGSGIAYGLEVAAAPGSDRVSAPSVTITPGLAIDRRGQTLALADPVELSLKALPADPSAVPPPISAFAVCEPADADAYVAGAGLYLLTIGAAEGKEGRAAVSGLGNIEASCNTKYIVPGVRFRLIQLDLQPADLNQPDLLRNRVAYRCFQGDAPVYDAFHANLFGPPVGGYGLIDDLRPGRLEDCEVPLALVYLTATHGLVFVDMWAARRRITAPAAAARFPLLTGDRRAAETEAMAMQFMQQLLDLRELSANPDRTRAIEVFRHVPPVGIVPLASSRFTRGFHPDLFFDTISHHPVATIEGARVGALFRAALDYPPLDLSSGVMVWIYRVRENQQAVETGTAFTAPQPYLIFTTGHMAYMGDAHFDVNRWGYGNYA
jgi:hypothetical protein